MLSTLSKFDELKELLEKALEVPGVDKANVYNEYGIMYEQEGNYEKAMEAYRQCARATLKNDVLNRAKDAIERCKIKAEL